MLCRSCGKRWPTSYSACPDDGTALGARDTQPANVHVAATRLLPSRRRLDGPPIDDRPTIVVTGEIHTDTVNIGRMDSDTVSVQEIHASDLDPFNPNDSDVLTVAVVARTRASPPPTATGPGSSEPPTSARRRYETHIDLPPGSIVNDEYEIAGRLGEGAMGEVYAARHIKLSKRVAIKVIAPRLSEDAGAIERFEQEARTLAQLSHPNIVDVLGFGELADGRAYFVMAFLAGEPLDARLERGRLQLVDRGHAFAGALDIFDQLARGLEAAHAHGVTHRDLKPANCFLERVTSEPRPVVKLLDFGLAKLAADVDRRRERTQSGAAIGTPLYMSPEQCRGSDVDHRTDIYALGCIAYELLLGRPPFNDALTTPALFAAHLHEAPPMPRSIWPEIPAQLDLMLFAMLAKDPAYRPTLTQIRSVIAGVRSTSTPSGRGRARAMTAPVAQRPSRAATFWIAGVALIGGIAIGAVAIGSRASGDGPAGMGTLNFLERRDAGGSSVVLPTTTAIDAAITVVVPPQSIDAGLVQPHVAPRSGVDAGLGVIIDPVDSVGPVDPIDAGSPTIEESPMDATPPAVESIPPTSTIDAAVRPTTVAPPVRRTTPKRPPPIDRNIVVDPFKKKSR